MYTPGAVPPSRYHYAWIILSVSTLVVFASIGLARFGYTMLLPPMQTGLGLDNTRAGAMATANLTGYLVLALVAGALASRFGPRRVLAVGLLVTALGMALTGLSNSFATATAARALSGIGSGASNVPVMGLLAGWFVAKRRGLASGIAVTGSSFALILLGWCVPLALRAFGDEGWRISWFVFAAITVVLAGLAFATLRNRPAEIGLHPLGTLNREAPPVSPASPLQWGRVYKSGLVWHVGLVYLAFGFSYIIYITFFSKYLMAEGGYTESAAGRLFMLMGWMSLACGLVWGWISDHIGRRATLTILFLIHAVAFGLFVGWPATPGFTVSAILFGLTAWSIPAIMAAICGDILGSRLAPAGLGFVTFFLSIGQAGGPTVAGYLADRTGSLTTALLLATAVALAGAAGAYWIHPTALARDVDGEGNYKQSGEVMNE